MSHGYSKKDDNPSKTILLLTLVLGLTISKVCFNFGIVSKNFSIFLNCLELSCSRKVFSSFFVQSEAANDSSGLKTCSIQSETKSKVSSTETSVSLKLDLIN